MSAYPQKCPICGSDLNTAIKCDKCGYDYNRPIKAYEEALEKYNIPQHTTPNLPDLEDKYKSSFGNLENNRLGGNKMIYIKTEMTEMPKSCKKCSCEFYGCCYIKGDNILGLKNRPSWCPLVEIKEGK